MPRVLYIGDVHATVESLEDCRRLEKRIVEVEEKEKPDLVVYLGDQYDNFALVRTEVQAYWKECFDWRKSQTVALVGNHDRPGDQAELSHAMQAHQHASGPVVADRPVSKDNILFMPYMFDGAAFEDEVAHYECNVLVCHQAFIGGKMENGLTITREMDRAAADPAKLPFKHIISGHIHTPMQFGNVTYVGSPRWRNNLSDANIDRHLWVMDFDDAGNVTATRKYPTGDVCRRLWRINEVEGETAEVPGLVTAKTGDLYVVDITGSARYIEERKAAWAEVGARIRATRTDRPGPKLSEAQGVQAAWNLWQSTFEPKYGTPAPTLADLARERVSL
jgi:predicted phosphodiesterase